MKRIAISLPNRVGDSILSLPAVLCLKQLYASSFPIETAVTLFAPSAMTTMVSRLWLFPTHALGWAHKAASWVRPYDDAFFLSTTSRDVGLRARRTYGEPLPHKWYCRYTHPLPALCLDGTREHLPPDLLDGLKIQHGLSLAASRYFQMVLALGFSPTQILDTLDLSALHRPMPLPADAVRSVERLGLPMAPYWVCCMEAGYGSKKADKRRMDPAWYIDITHQIWRQYGVATVFVGLETEPDLPNAPYCYDVRGRLSLTQIAVLFYAASAYLGNDSGLLHLANLLRLPSVALYQATHPDVYGPIFAHLSHPVVQPASVADIWPAVEAQMADVINHALTIPPSYS